MIQKCALTIKVTNSSLGCIRKRIAWKLKPWYEPLGDLRADMDERHGHTGVNPVDVQKRWMERRALL